MSDPQRLLEQGTDLEARLLSAALDEPPPADLLARTLQTVGAAAPGAAVASGAAAKAGAAAAAKGGLWGAIAAGAIAGVLAVGGFALATRSEPRPTRAVPAVTAAVEKVAPPTIEAPAPPAAEPAPVPSAAPAASASAVASAARPVALMAEVALLDEARGALNRGEIAAARALLDRYAKEHPRGQMAREAAQIRADVEAAAGKTNP
jgi:hypothetical protein